METVLGQRTLNRTLLERQFLLRRSGLDVADVVARLGNVQAQVPGAPYIGLWSRVEGFDPHDVGRRIEDGSLVRAVLQRATLHLATARDARTWRPAVQPVLDRALMGNFRRDLDGLDLAEVAAAGATLLAERPRPISEVGRALAPRWPDRDPEVLGVTVAYSTPLYQLPPRGVWGRSGRALLAPLDTGPAATPDELVLRYLRAFGPASTSDARTFLGINGIREVVNRLDLRRYRDERGRELFDVPDGPLLDPDVPAPPRFLGEFDNVLLGHDDRTRVLPDEHRAAILLKPVRPLLVDGLAAGTWRSGPTGITVTLAGPITDDQRADVVAEGERLLAALWPSAERAVRFAG